VADDLVGAFGPDDLTAGDRKAYATQAQAQRSKGFENVDVTFDPSPKEDPDGAKEKEKPAEGDADRLGSDSRGEASR